MTAAETLAKHFVGLSFEAVPRKHIDDVATLTADYLGVALAGSQTGSGKVAAKFVTETGGKGEATLIGGSGVRVPALHAAFANAIASHSVELDDVDILALFHFSPPVISAALAAAEMVGASGKEFILAAVAGCEMMARVSDATNPSLRDRGYHSTPTCGVFGATIAAAKLMKLDETQTVSALGLAGAQASGLMEMYGPSMQKRFNPGPAARNGVTSAVMAKLGFTGAATILDGERGFCRAFSDEFDVAKLTRGLGSEFPIYIEYKPYSCARPIHNAIDCALAVRSQMVGKNDKTESIRSIRMRRHPAWAHYHLNATPKTYHEAQVSLPYSVAVALIEGAALLPQYQDAKLKEPEILRLSKMVAVSPDDSLPRGVSCHITVETANGASYAAQVDHPRGSIANPMTDAELAGKIHLLADPLIGNGAVTRLVEMVKDVAGLPQASAIMAATQIGAAR